MNDEGPKHLEHFAPQDATETAQRFGASAALGPEDIGDEPDTDVEPPDGHEIDGLSDPD